MIRDHQPSAVWATGPPFETLKASYFIARAAGLPLIIDMRDPWTHGVCWQPSGWFDARREHAWERRVLSYAARVVVTTPLTEHRMRTKYPKLASKFMTITNGFEDTEPVADVRSAEKRMIVSYVGAINSNYRNPQVLLDAVARIRSDYPAIAAPILVRLVGPSSDYDVESRVKELGGIVEYLGPVSYTQSIECINSSDVLVLLQLIEDGHDVIGAKTFEYLLAKKPIIGVVKPSGGDDWLLQHAGVGRTVGTCDPSAIVRCIIDCFEKWKAGELAVDVDDKWLAQFHRRSLTARLAEIVLQVVNDHREDGKMAGGRKYK